MARRAAVVAVLLLASLTAGCQRVSRPTNESARAYALDALRPWADGDAVRFHTTLAELLPNVSFRVDGRPPTPEADAVVVGRVAGVEPGVRRGDARTFHLTVAVERRIGSTVATGTVGVGLAADAAVDPARLEWGLRAVGRLVLFLDASSPVFAYDPGRYGVVGNGGMLATVDAAGRLGLPLKRPDEQAALLAGAATLDELERAVAATPRVIDVDHAGRRL